MKKSILAADIGGTSSRFCAFEVQEDGSLQQGASNWLKTTENESFESLLKNLSKESPELSPSKFDICVFAVAGPIEAGHRCSPPNIDWQIDLRRAESEHGIKRFALINDFLAQAFACVSPVVEGADLILPGEAKGDATIAVVGAGTGLGKAALLRDGSGKLLGMPSEGGHANFAAESEREFEFQQDLLKRLGREYLVWDEVVSGRGLSSIHRFLTKEELEPSEVAAKFSEESETLIWAARFYARVCRNFALETLSKGGVYIAGGVAAKNPILLQHPVFEQTFRASHTHQAVLAKLPVYLLDNEESGLWGAAFFGSQELQGE